MKVGDLVISARGHWCDPRIVVKTHETAKALIGILCPDGQIKWIHYRHLEIISESR